MTANRVLASVHSRDAWLHASAARSGPRHGNFVGAASFGIWPRARAARRDFEPGASYRCAAQMIRRTPSGDTTAGMIRPQFHRKAGPLSRLQADIAGRRVADDPRRCAADLRRKPRSPDRRAQCRTSRLFRTMIAAAIAHLLSRLTTLMWRTVENGTPDMTRRRRRMVLAGGRDAGHLVRLEGSNVRAVGAKQEAPAIIGGRGVIGRQAAAFLCAEGDLERAVIVGGHTAA